ncbi:MAG TPA: hypothetical protein VMB50_20730 [Myxococcales bacterium]|nr:hypothetical protein [Myxococcales bacterium]
MRTLDCKVGKHKWQDSGKRRPPLSCPEHNPRAKKLTAAKRRKVTAAAPVAPPQRRRPKGEEPEELTALERARAFEDQAEELVEALILQRVALNRQIEEVDAAMARIGGHARPKQKPHPAVAAPARKNVCRHGVAEASCSLCSSARADRRRLLDEAATARPGAGDAI